MAVLAASGVLVLPIRRHPRLADRVALAFLGLGAALGSCAVAFSLRAPAVPTFDRGWSLPIGRFSLALDGLSAAFLPPVLLLPLLAAWYGLGYWPEARKPSSAPRARVFLGILAATMELLVLARDGVLFLLAFECLTLAAFFLITVEDEREETRRAGWLYLVAAHCSLLALVAAFALLNASQGSFALAPLGSGALPAGPRVAILALALVGFGIKAGIMPFHVWLPDAHAAAPSHVSAVLSGVVIKMGVYGLARLSAILPDPSPLSGIVLLVLGAWSGVAGVVFALGQHDLKKLLAYHSIENIGIIVMGLGLALLGRWAGRVDLVFLGFACAVMHVWNHALFKSLLFFSAGSVVHASGTREIDRLGGLLRGMPWTGASFLLGAVAICGLPPLNGFVSELYLYLGSLHSLQGQGTALGAVVAPVLAIIGALACACFIKVFAAVFLGHPRHEPELLGHEVAWSMRAPLLVLAGVCLLLGAAPGLVTPLLVSATGAWAGVHGGAVLESALPFVQTSLVMAGTLALAALFLWGLRLRAARAGVPALPTWDCGFARPTARMQYTASSLAATLVHLFAFLLRPRRRAPRLLGPFPGPGSFHERVDDPVLLRLFEPAANGITRWFVRLRQLQTGRIQGYLVYVLGMTIILLLAVLPVLGLLERIGVR